MKHTAKHGRQPHVGYGAIKASKPRSNKKANAQLNAQLLRANKPAGHASAGQLVAAGAVTAQ